MQYIQTQFPGTVDIRMEHLTYEFDARRFVGILLLKMHNQAKGPVFKGCVSWPDDDSIPFPLVSFYYSFKLHVASYQVITLSAMGEAETPAGGSVCIRWMRSSSSASVQLRADDEAITDTFNR